MNNYELVFFVNPVSDATEDRLIDELDAMIEDRGGQYVITVNEVGENGYLAAQAAVKKLTQLGVRPRRLDLDLVTQSIVSDRAGVTRASVTGWVQHGLNGRSFPEAHTWLNGPVWAWDDVNEWLRCVRSKGAAVDSYRSPNASEVARVNVWLEAGPAAARPARFPLTSVLKA